MNKYLVGVQGDNVVSLKLGFKLSRADALELAAMIAVIADPSGEEFDKARERIENGDG